MIISPCIIIIRGLVVTDR